MASLQLAAVVFRALVEPRSRTIVEQRVTRPFRGRALVVASPLAPCMFSLRIGVNRQFHQGVPGAMFLLPTFTTAGVALVDGMIERVVACGDELEAPMLFGDPKVRARSASIPSELAQLAGRALAADSALACDVAVAGWCVAVEVENPTDVALELRALLIGSAFP